MCSNECFVSFIIKLDVSEDCTNNKRSDLFDGWINSDGEGGLCEFEFGSLDLLQIDFEGSDEGGLSEEIGSVIHTVEFVVGFFLGLWIVFDGLFDLNTELEAELVELFESVFLAHEFIKAVLFDFKVWHVFIVW